MASLEKNRTKEELQLMFEKTHKIRFLFTIPFHRTLASQQE